MQRQHSTANEWYFFVPGQRFRELYYWDTYWVVKGLLVSSMQESAKVGLHDTPSLKYLFAEFFMELLLLR